MLVFRYRLFELLRFHIIELVNNTSYLENNMMIGRHNNLWRVQSENFIIEVDFNKRTFNNDLNPNFSIKKVISFLSSLLQSYYESRHKQIYELFKKISISDKLYANINIEKKKKKIIISFSHSKTIYSSWESNNRFYFKASDKRLSDYYGFIQEVENESEQFLFREDYFHPQKINFRIN